MCISAVSAGAQNSARKILDAWCYSTPSDFSGKIGNFPKILEFSNFLGRNLPTVYGLKPAGSRLLSIDDTSSLYARSDLTERYQDVPFCTLHVCNVITRSRERSLPPACCPEPSNTVQNPPCWTMLCAFFFGANAVLLRISNLNANILRINNPFLVLPCGSSTTSYILTTLYNARTVHNTMLVYYKYT